MPRIVIQFEAGMDSYKKNIQKKYSTGVILSPCRLFQIQPRHQGEGCIPQSA